MKIEKTDKSTSTSSTKKKEGASSGSSVFGSMLTSETEGKPQVSSSGSLGMVDALLAVQGAENPTEKAAKKRMRHRAETLLAELDKIRMGLLTGNMTVGDVIGVADVVASHREKIMDPALTAILDEIDLRAQVELAKIKIALHNR